MKLPDYIEFLTDDILVITACIILKAEGLKVPELTHKHLNNEIAIKRFELYEDFLCADMITEPPTQMSRS